MTSLRKSIRCAFLFSLFLEAIAGCAAADSNASPTENIPAEIPSDSVVVSAGTAPSFTWRAGFATAIQVVQAAIADNTQERWNVFAADTVIGFASPVVYGVLPAKTTSSFGAAQPLVHGVTYAVVVYWKRGDVSLTEFVP